MKKPFMFKEASLPAGFPAPGLVGEVVVKQYPAARVAMTGLDSTTTQPTKDNDLFDTLFDHINTNKIAMSTPVAMTYENDCEAKSDPETMAFYYNDLTIGKPGRDGAVEVKDVPPVKVVSIGVRGSYNRKNFDAAVVLLNKFISDNSDFYKPTGQPRFMGYNSPFVPWFWRYGEVQIPVSELSQ